MTKLREIVFDYKNLTLLAGTVDGDYPDATLVHKHFPDLIFNVFNSCINNQMLLRCQERDGKQNIYLPPEIEKDLYIIFNEGRKNYLREQEESREKKGLDKLGELLGME